MTLVTIPIQPIPNQSVAYQLNGSFYTIDILTRGEGLYIDVWTADGLSLSSRALLSYAPVGFGLQLVDTQGTDDPVYTGLGSRWLLQGLQL